MIRIACVDNEEKELENLRALFVQFEQANPDPKIDVSYFDDPYSFLESNDNFDIVFLDILMNTINGMEIAERMRERGSKASIIFVTNTAEFAVKGYSVGAIDYVLKPIAYPRFSTLLSKTIRLIREDSGITISLKTDGKVVRFSTSDIIYVEVDDHLLIYHTVQGDYQTWGPISNVEKTLPDKWFVRVNHGTIINIDYVLEIDDNDIILKGAKKKIPISRSKRKNTMDKILGGTSS